MANYLNLIFFASFLCTALVHCSSLKPYENGVLNFERDGQKHRVAFKAKFIEGFFGTCGQVDEIHKGKDEAELKAGHTKLGKKGHFFNVRMTEDTEKGEELMRKAIDALAAANHARAQDKSLLQMVGEPRGYRVETGKLKKKDGKDEISVKFVIHEYQTPESLVEDLKKAAAAAKTKAKTATDAAAKAEKEAQAAAKHKPAPKAPAPKPKPAPKVAKKVEGDDEEEDEEEEEDNQPELTPAELKAVETKSAAEAATSAEKAAEKALKEVTEAVEKAKAKKKAEAAQKAKAAAAPKTKLPVHPRM